MIDLSGRSIASPRIAGILSFSTLGVCARDQNPEDAPIASSFGSNHLDPRSRRVSACRHPWRRQCEHNESGSAGSGLELRHGEPDLAVHLPAWLSRYAPQPVTGDDGERLPPPASGQGQPQGDEDHLYLVSRWSLLLPLSGADDHGRFSDVLLRARARTSPTQTSSRSTARLSLANSCATCTAGRPT